MESSSSIPHGRARRSRSLQVTDIIKQRIKRGIYLPGDQLPSFRAFSAEFNITIPAVQRGVQQLVKEGLVESRPGVGTRILGTADCTKTPLLFGFIQPYFSQFSLALQHYIEVALDSRSDLCIMKSSHNDPARECREIQRLIASGVTGLIVCRWKAIPMALFCSRSRSTRLLCWWIGCWKPLPCPL